MLSGVRQSKYAQQLDQLLSDHQFPDVARLVDTVNPARLALIAERKGMLPLCAGIEGYMILTETRRARLNSCSLHMNAKIIYIMRLK